MKSVQIRSFSCYVFSCIRTEYGDLLRKSPYSIRIQENTDPKKLRIWTLFTHWGYTLFLIPVLFYSGITNSGQRRSHLNSAAGIIAGNWMFKVNSRSTRTRCEIFSKLTIKTPKRRQWRRSGVFMVNFENLPAGIVLFIYALRKNGRRRQNIILFIFDIPNTNVMKM